MTAIRPLWNEMPLSPLGAAQGKSAAGTSFTDAFQSALGSVTNVFQTAVDNVIETDAEKTQLEYLMATGQLDNPAELVIASSKAQLAVDLLVQLRNKAVEAYSELTRINL